MKWICESSCDQRNEVRPLGYEASGKKVTPVAELFGGSEDFGAGLRRNARIEGECS
jgi:hypothetical protein